MSVTISGAPTTQAVSLPSLPLPADAATETTLAALLTELAQKLESGQSIVVSSAPTTAVTGPLTDVQLRAADVKITLDGETVTIGAALPAGTNAIGKLAANSGVDIGDVDVTSLPAINLTDISIGDYETVAASQTAQVLGGAGAIGDYIAGLLIVPALLSPGQVLLLDNATSITVFAGGVSSVATLIPFFVPLGIKSVSGAWKVTTGASVSVIAMGNFT